MAKKNIIRTHKRVASVASKALRNARNRKIRSIAGAALSNRRR